VLRFAWEPAYCRGRIRFVACGENVTPARRDITRIYISTVIFREINIDRESLLIQPNVNKSENQQFDLFV